MTCLTDDLINSPATWLALKAYNWAMVKYLECLMSLFIKKETKSVIQIQFYRVEQFEIEKSVRKDSTVLLTHVVIYSLYGYMEITMYKYSLFYYTRQCY